jgi:hypothetical protein
VAYQRLLLFLAIALAISSCVSVLETDINIKLRSKEKWEAEIQLVFAPQQLVLVASQLEAELSRRTRSYQNLGIDANWRREQNPSDGNIVYVINAKGQGFDAINQAIFDGKPALQIDDSSGKNQIIFQHSPGPSSLGIVARQTFTLSGGRLVSSNGSQIDSSTVTWTNPTRTMEAVFTETSDIPWIVVGVIALGILAILIIGYFRIGRTSLIYPSTSYPPRTPITPSLRFCAFCGSEFPDQAMFCPRCGKRR